MPIYIQQIISALMFILAAGVLSGSFALPIKYITKWKFENIWLLFAFWAFLIVPWTLGYLFLPQLFHVYAATPMYLLLTIFIGGFLFGIGQLCFAFALDMIGLGLAFLINLGIGTSLGFLMPLVFQHPQKIMTPFGLITLVGTICAISGLIISNYAGIMRDRERSSYLQQQAEQTDSILTVNSRHMLGVLLAVVAGLFSAGQNFTFSLTYHVQEIARQLSDNGTEIGAASAIWPLFLTCSFVPYFLYVFYLLKKNRSFSNYKVSGAVKYHSLVFIMGLFWGGCLLLYSKGTQLIGSLGPLVGWPIFMVSIILVSSFWGWKQKEWENCSGRSKNFMKLGLLFLVAAIFILAYGASST